MDSDSSYDGTPPNIKEAAANVISDLLPTKSITSKLFIMKFAGDSVVPRDVFLESRTGFGHSSMKMFQGFFCIQGKHHEERRSLLEASTILAEHLMKILL
ncbi:hypothetical protein O3M35_009855 [Rhynocoris fuscipes]|uniref:Uncharacterized protein n=1 Tax=Rhynocoris fuscipes TaxID=488301 RepID=A0AAW1D812_9HEMI